MSSIPMTLQPAPASSASEASLRSMRILLALCMLVPLLVYVGFGYYRYQQMHEDAQLRLDRALRIANEHAQKVLETNEALLLHMRSLARPDEQRIEPAREQQLSAELKVLSADKPQIQSLWIIGADGRPLASDRFSPLPDVNYADRDYFEWHRALRGGVFFSQVQVGKATKTPFFDLSLARTTADGRFAGVVATSLRPEYFQAFHADLGANEPGLAITMFRDDGLVYSRWPQLANQAARMSPDSPVMQRVRAGDDHGMLRGVSSMDKQDRLLLYQRVGRFPVYLGTGMQLAAVRAAWLREMALLGLFGAVPVAGLLVAALFALRRSREALDAERRLRDESQARQQMEEALLQAQKLEAVGRLTGGVAHDFNNALMVISANLHVLRMTRPEVVGRQTDAIGRAVDSATKLTRQLLAFSRRQALLPQTVDLQERLPPLASLLSPVLGSRVTLTIEVAPGTWPVRVDVAELELGLINLAVNARDAMPEGGRFTVRARNVASVLPLHAQPMVLIEASDTGTGMPPEIVSKVFEPFFTTKPVGEGTGLGLSQVYALCQRSGGSASIDSTPGVGTTVRLAFPPDLQGTAPLEAPSAPATALRRTVLMVEDNAEVAQAVMPVLQELGCTVTHLDRATKARDWLAAQAGQGQLPEVLLTDVVMPGEMDGLALARHVRERYPQVQVVVMTGYAQQLDTLSEMGFQVLPKPWSAEMLVRALREVAAQAPSAG
jgi:signal transduction histidine kinase/CheY-like chemotaxis protein